MTTGEISACCHSQTPIRKENGEPYRLDQGDSFENAFFSPYMDSLRANMLNGVRDPQCQQCWKLEDLGLKSKRIDDGNRYLAKTFARLQESAELPFRPLSWDIKLGTQCNLKCRMCNDETSSAILTESVATGAVTAEFARGFNRRFGNLLQDGKFKAELERLIPYAEEVYFLGGEPSLIPEHLDILDYAIASGAAKNMRVRWSTNLAKFDQRFVDRARQFKHVTIDCSIDGYGPVNEYIRFPAQWNFVDSRVRALKQELPQARMTGICTIQIYNAFELEQLLSWGDSFGFSIAFNYLSFPPKLSVQCLPQPIKMRIKEKYAPLFSPKLDQFINWMMSPGSDSDFTDFCSYTEKMDAIREQNFLSLIPESFRGPMHEAMEHAKARVN